MKKRYTLLAIAALMMTIAATAQTLTITTSGGTKQYSASDITSSSPATFSNNGTWMTIGSNVYPVTDIVSALVATENYGYVKKTCAVCDGSTHCTTCHGTGKGCKTCNGTGNYCKECNSTGTCPRCNGSSICMDCGGDGYSDCSHCFGYYGYCNTCKGRGWQIKPEWGCPLCGGFKYCLYCEGNYQNAEKCTSCNGSGNCRRCKDNKGKCYTCNGNPYCKTCGGDGHCFSCKNSDGKCTSCNGRGYNWVDIMLSDKSFEFSYLGESKDLSITINQAWKATCSSSWISFINAEGRNSDKLTINAEANPTENSRSATIVISYGSKSEYVTVTQEGTPYLRPSKKDVSFDATPTGSEKITIDCNRSWYASSNREWLTVSPKNGSGYGSLTLIADKNPTMDAREASVTLTCAGATETINVTQAAGEGFIEVQMANSNYIYGGDSHYLEIQASDRRVWTVERESNDTWVHIDTSTSTSQIYNGMGSKSLRIYVDQNPSFFSRNTKLTIRSGSYYKTITIVQYAGEMYLRYMVSYPLAVVNVNLMTESLSTVYNTLASAFNVTASDYSFIVSVDKNPSLTGISYRGLPLSYFEGKTSYSRDPKYSYHFEIDKSYISNIDPYVSAIINDFKDIGVNLKRDYDYNYDVYYDYFDNVRFDVYVFKNSSSYTINIEIEYR